MSEYALIFRRKTTSGSDRPSPAEMQASIKPWQEWLGSIAAQNKLTDKGMRLESDGFTIKSDQTITNGPFAETKEIISGMIVIEADSYESAVDIGKGCPVLLPPWNGTVEVRELLKA